MRPSNKFFIKYYDKLFQNKNYDAESKYILKLFKKYSHLKTPKILDLGCGTGCHTIIFANLGYDITGLDLDPLMIEIAKNKTNTIDFILGDITSYKFNMEFSLIFSFFNVINYISNIIDLRDFMIGSYKNLREGGIFIFDSWNGNRFVIDPPIEKIINIESEKFSAKGVLNPNYDIFYNTSRFHYSIEIDDNGFPAHYDNVIHQTFWSPLVISQLLTNAGFKINGIFSHLTEKNATFNDAKLCWICIKE